MPLYHVTAVYEDTDEPQHYGTVVHADDEGDAERVAQENCIVDNLGREPEPGEDIGGSYKLVDFGVKLVHVEVAEGLRELHSNRDFLSDDAFDALERACDAFDEFREALEKDPA